MRSFVFYSRPKAESDNTGRFGIGTSFIQPLEEPGQMAVLISATSPIMPSTPTYNPDEPNVEPYGGVIDTSPIAVAAPPIKNFATPKPGTIGPSLYPIVTPQVSGENSMLSKPKSTPNMSNPDLYCEACDISVTSIKQMDTHKTGQKHIKRCKQLGL